MRSIAASRECVRRDEAVIASFNHISFFPLAIKSGHGATVEDMDGNVYIDLLASAGSQNVGFGNEEVAAAVNQQMLRYGQCTNAYIYNPLAAELAEKLIEITPGSFPKKVAFGLTGSDSIDGAIKLAKCYTGRNKMITFAGAYHGSTFGALSVSAVSLNMRRSLGTLLPDVYCFPYPNVYREGPDCGRACLNAIRSAFSTYLPADEVAAVVFEPIQGDGGIIVPPEGFLKELAALCKEHGILLICDEIQQGMMRTGKWFAVEHFGIEPDILVAGKSIGGGLPLSAIIARGEIMDAMHSPAHLFTMGANAACCASALAAIRCLSQPERRREMAENAAHLSARLHALEEKYAFVGIVRGIGFSWGIELVTDKKSKTPNRVAADKICYRGWERGIITISMAGNVLRVQPTLVITREEIDRAMDILDACMAEFRDGKISDEALNVVKGW